MLNPRIRANCFRNYRELAEYEKSTSKDHLIILSDDDEGYSIQDKESLKNPSNEIAVSKPDNESEKEPEATTDTEISSTEDIHPLVVQEPPQDYDTLQLIREECCIEVAEEEKQKMEDTILDLEVKNVEEQPAERRNQSNAKNLLPIPSECEVTSKDESECDIPAKDDSSPAFTTFSNHLFDDNDDIDSSDNESLSEEDVPAEEFKVYSNPLFDEDEINSDKLEPHCFNVEFDFIESLLNRDTFIDSSSKFNFLLKEFSGSLAHINPVLLEIKEADFDFEEDIHFIENLLYDNSSPRPSEDLNAEIADTIVESLPSSFIPVQDNDAREEIDLVTNTDELLSPPFENEKDVEEEIDVVEALQVDNSTSFLVNESFQDDPSIPRPPLEPLDDEFDLEPEVISAVMNDVDECNKYESFDPGGEIIISTKNEDVDYVSFMFVIRIFLPYLVLPEISPLFLSTESEDTIFDPGISV
nr:hypothetical protein [Tanacetum cinerariifolium]